MEAVKEVGNNVFLIDDELYSIPGSGAIYLLNEDQKALIDTGPTTSARAVIKGVRKLGIKTEEIDYLILTHIHLDHAGGVGTLLQSMPHAKVLAHHRAIKHLLNPAKLIQSAIIAQGEKTLQRNGEILPVPIEHLVPVCDGDTLKLSNEQTLTLMECPGHAPHELCICESRNRGVFVGDAVGHIIEGTNIMVPITPPPSFDLELYLKTLQRLSELNEDRIYFAHYGVSHQVEEKIEAAERELRARNSIIARAFSEDKADLAFDRVTEHIRDGLEVIHKELENIYDYWLAVDIPMSISEHIKYYKSRLKV